MGFVVTTLVGMFLLGCLALAFVFSLFVYRYMPGPVHFVLAFAVAHVLGIVFIRWFYSRKKP